MNNSKRNIFKAGVAKTNITPKKGSIIGVDFLMHYARFIHDDLYAKALAISDGDTIFLFVVLDICIMPSDLMCQLKQQITKDTGVNAKHIMLSCTHTHGAGDVAGLLGGAVDIDYRNSLAPLVAKACKGAFNALQPAQITHGHTYVSEFQKCRRYKMDDSYVAKNPVTGKNDSIKTNPFNVENSIIEPASPVDSYLGYLALKTYDDKYICVLANYGMHYAGDWDVDTITADYYGAFDERLSEKLNHKIPSFMGIMTYGCGADVNTWDFLNKNISITTKEKPFAKTEAIGYGLADAIVENLETSSWSKTPKLVIQYANIPIKIRKPSIEELRNATKYFEAHRFENLKIDEFGIQSIYAREQILLEAYQKYHTSIIQTIKIDDLVIGASGAELFSETGMSLRSKVKADTYFTVCLANSYDGYVPPKHEMEKGGYETWRARSSFLNENAEAKLSNELLNLINKS